MDLIDDCKRNDNFSPLIRTLGEIFSNIECLSRSFLQTDDSLSDGKNTTAGGNVYNVQRIYIIQHCFPDSIKGLNKETVRALEGEKDKDVDSSAVVSKNSIPPVDLPSLKRCYNAIFELDPLIYETPLVNALVTLAGNLQMELPTRKDKVHCDDIVNVLMIVFEIPVVGKSSRVETLYQVN